MANLLKILKDNGLSLWQGDALSLKQGSYEVFPKREKDRKGLPSLRRQHEAAYNSGDFMVKPSYIPNVISFKVLTGVLNPLLAAFGISAKLGSHKLIIKGRNSKYNRYLSYMFLRLKRHRKNTKYWAIAMQLFLFSHAYLALMIHQQDKTLYRTKSYKEIYRLIKRLNELRGLEHRSHLRKLIVSNIDSLWLKAGGYLNGKHYCLVSDRLKDHPALESFITYNNRKSCLPVDIEMRRVYVAKGGKDGVPNMGYSPVATYRPLAVPTLVWRIYLRMLLPLLTGFFRVDNNQHGFVPGRGTLTAWREMFTKILNRKNIYEIDLSQFFPSVNTNLVYAYMKSKGMTGWIADYFLDLGLSYPAIDSLNEKYLEEPDALAKAELDSIGVLRNDLYKRSDEEVAAKGFENIEKARIPKSPPKLTFENVNYDQDINYWDFNSEASKAYAEMIHTQASMTFPDINEMLPELGMKRLEPPKAPSEPLGSNSQTSDEARDPNVIYMSEMPDSMTIGELVNNIDNWIFKSPSEKEYVNQIHTQTGMTLEDISKTFEEISMEFKTIQLVLKTDPRLNSKENQGGKRGFHTSCLNSTTVHIKMEDANLGNIVINPDGTTSTKNSIPPDAEQNCNYNEDTKEFKNSFTRHISPAIRGYPQGSGLSPFLSILLLNFVLRQLPKDSDVQHIFYADDGLLASNMKFEDFKHWVDNTFVKVLEEYGVKVNVHKSSYSKKDGKWNQDIKFLGMRYGGKGEFYTETRKGRHLLYDKSNLIGYLRQIETAAGDNHLSKDTHKEMLKAYYSVLSANDEKALNFLINDDLGLSSKFSFRKFLERLKDKNRRQSVVHHFEMLQYNTSQLETILGYLGKIYNQEDNPYNYRHRSSINRTLNSMYGGLIQARMYFGDWNIGRFNTPSGAQNFKYRFRTGSLAHISKCLYGDDITVFNGTTICVPEYAKMSLYITKNLSEAKMKEFKNKYLFKGVGINFRQETKEIREIIYEVWKGKLENTARKSRVAGLFLKDKWI